MPASELPFANFFGCMVLDTVIGGLEVKLKLMGQERVTRSFPSSTMRTIRPPTDLGTQTGGNHTVCGQVK
jgi:hypothetical protein